MDVLTKSAEEFGNDGLVEQMWAQKAFEHAEIYFNLVCSVNPRLLKLTPFDDEIYTAFRQEFPDLNIELLDENKMKSADGKVKWRNFIQKFNKLDSYDFGTLIRTSSKEEFSAQNSMLVVRMEFLAIEIARNREGLNDNLRNIIKNNELSLKEES